MRLVSFLIFTLIFVGCAQGGGLNTSPLRDGGTSGGYDGGITIPPTIPDTETPPPNAPECLKVNEGVTLCAGIPLDQVNNCTTSASPLHECMKASDTWCRNQTVLTDKFEGGAGLLNLATNNTAWVVCLATGNVFTKVTAKLSDMKFDLTADTYKTRVGQQAVWTYCKDKYPPGGQDKLIGAGFGPVTDVDADGKISFYCSVKDLANAQNYFTSVYASTKNSELLTTSCNFTEGNNPSPPPADLSCSFAVHKVCSAGFNGDKFSTGYGPVAWNVVANDNGGTDKAWRILCFR